MIRTLLLLSLCLVPLPLRAQFRLLQVDSGGVETPVASVQDLGTVGVGDSLDRQFRLRNVSTSSQPLRLLEVAGTGFSLGSAPSLPRNVAPGDAIDFSVNFRPASEGSYSAALRSEGISVLLTVTAVAQMTVALDTPAGAFPLPTGSTVSGGMVELGSSASLHLRIINTTSRQQSVPLILVAGGDFAFEPGTDAGLLNPHDEATFTVRFSPSATGPRTGTLTVGSRNFVLTGTGVEPPTPQPRLAVTLPQASSGVQGTIEVFLASTAKVALAGSVTLDFTPLLPGASDPAILLSSGGRSTTFTVQPAGDRANFGNATAVGFQTGTTAGTLTVTVKLGGLTDQQTVQIAPAPAALLAPVTSRGTQSLTVSLAGFDNTRTAGPLTFSFFDRNGTLLGSAVRADASADFGSYFRASDAGGLFVLRATFPVTGDATLVDAVEVELANSAGASHSVRTKF